MSKTRTESTAGAKKRDEIKDIAHDYSSCFEALKPIRDTWAEKESMLMGKTEDSSKAKSQIYDPRLSSAIFERMTRVMAQLPTGQMRATSGEDKGAASLLNLVHANYVIPNANTQYDILTKLRLLDYYSLGYGSMFALVDYIVTDSYVGPDFHIIPIRNIVPQKNKYTINDCDYVYIRSEVSKAWLKSKKDSETWNTANITKLLDQNTKGSSTFEVEHLTKNEQVQQSTAKEKETYTLITRYEKDRWITFAESSNLLLRDVENPNHNSTIPIVAKHAFPLLDRFFGLGDLERGKTLQYALNSLWKMYLDSVATTIKPPLVAYLPDIVGSTLRNEPGNIIALKNPNLGSIRPLELSPQGLQSFSSTYQYMIASIQNMLGSSDTSVSSEVDPTMGKTPQALRMQSARESARDNFDRIMMERTVEGIYDQFSDLIVHNQEKDIPLNLFSEEIGQLVKKYPDLDEYLDIQNRGERSQVSIKHNLFTTKESKFKFYVDSGSTLKKDELSENESLSQILGLILKLPNAAQQAMQTGEIRIGKTVINVGEALKRYIISSQVTDWEKIVRDEEQAQPGQVNFEDPNLAQMMQGVQPQQPQVQTPVPQPNQEMKQPINPQDQVDVSRLSPEMLQVFQELQGYGRTSGNQPR